MITAEGTTKVLDFGVAKLVTEPGLSTHTSTGVIVGTVAYMSPEQVSGVQVDARSDIFSFGVLLYEMTTGRQPFQRDSTAATVAAVLNHEPQPADAVATDLPAAVVDVIGRCMRKNPDERFGAASEVRSALSAVLVRDAEVHRDTRESNRSFRWLGLGIGIVAIAAAGAAFSVWRSSTDRTRELTTALKAVPLTSYPFWETSPTFSPDGSQVAFVWQGPKGDNSDIYVKVVGQDHLSD
jgi:eukaryotic-like serine/threonine-protein kinase